MYYALFLKTENLPPDERNTADENGQVWLHTGVQAATRIECEAELEKRIAHGNLFGIVCETKIEYID